MKKTVVLILALLLLASPHLSFAQSSQTRTIIDCAGDKVTVPAEVHTVINLVAYGCQAMTALGLGEYLVGINNDNTIESQWIVDMYPRILEIKQYDPESSAEVLLMADADVVIVENPVQARQLRSKGVTAVTFTYYSIDEVRYAYRMLGDLLCGDAQTQCYAYVDYLDANIARVSGALEGKLVTRETLYYINGVSNKGLYKTTGYGSTNWAEAELSYTNYATSGLIDTSTSYVDAEAILAVNPENIIIGGRWQHVLYDQLMASPEWESNTAVMNGHVFKVPMGISAWNRYGIEIALMIPWTAWVVYPEYFDFDPLYETINFYQQFTGYTLTEEQAGYILNGLTPQGEKEIAN